MPPRAQMGDRLLALKPGQADGTKEWADTEAKAGIQRVLAKQAAAR